MWIPAWALIGFAIAGLFAAYEAARATEAREYQPLPPPSLELLAWQAEQRAVERREFKRGCRWDWVIALSIIGGLLLLIAVARLLGGN